MQSQLTDSDEDGPQVVTEAELSFAAGPEATTDPVSSVAAQERAQVSLLNISKQ